MKIEIDLTRNEAHELNVLLLGALHSNHARSRAANRAFVIWSRAYLEAMQKGDES